MSAVLEVAPDLVIPVRELEIRVSRASGPGGQGVNTADSRVEVRFDLLGSPSLSEAQRDQLVRRLGYRLDARGRLRVVSQTHRSQLANREAALERMRRLLAGGLRTQRPRTPTSPSPEAVTRRIAAKHRRAQTKRHRQRPAADEE